MPRPANAATSSPDRKAIFQPYNSGIAVVDQNVKDVQGVDGRQSKSTSGSWTFWSRWSGNIWRCSRRVLTPSRQRAGKRQDNGSYLARELLEMDDLRARRSEK